MKWKLAVFDLDGTILDTLDDLAASNAYALQKNHLPTRTTEEVRNFVGNGIAKLIERSVPQGTDAETREKVLKDFREHYAANCIVKTAPYPGVTELLKTLRAKGIKTAVVSNKADFAVQKLCERFFDGLFDCVVGEREGIRRKPAPDSVLEVLRVLNEIKEDSVYIGDSEVDVRTAANAEMDCITVTWGFRGEETLREAGAEVILKEITALEEALTHE